MRNVSLMLGQLSAGVSLGVGDFNRISTPFRFSPVFGDFFRPKVEQWQFLAFSKSRSSCILFLHKGREKERQLRMVSFVKSAWAWTVRNWTRIWVVVVDPEGVRRRSDAESAKLEAETILNVAEAGSRLLEDPQDRRNFTKSMLAAAGAVATRAVSRNRADTRFPPLRNAGED
jgi:hypothetical protein